jgi:hypothetical protein
MNKEEGCFFWKYNFIFICVRLPVSLSLSLSLSLQGSCRDCCSLEEGGMDEQFHFATAVERSEVGRRCRRYGYVGVLHIIMITHDIFH